MSVRLLAATALAAAAPAITAHGVGDVHVGDSYSSLHKAGLVGTIHHGCTGLRSAKLTGGARGRVDFVRHKAADIQVTGGDATANGAGIGATVKQIKRAFPGATVDHSTDDVRGFTLVVAKHTGDGGSAIAYAVSTKSGRTTEIGVPYLAVCP